MAFLRERLAHIEGDLDELIYDHYGEAGRFAKQIGLDVDWKKLYLIEKTGSLYAFTIRDLGALIGYAIMIVDEHHHNKGTKVATCDAIYIIPERRGEMTADFFEFIEEFLKEHGVKVLSFNLKKESNKLMPSLGFELNEYVYSKYIG
jgi:hypothetical protein